MPKFEGQFISVVFVGRQNPRILNHDFLVHNGVLPVDQEPFRELLRTRDRPAAPDEFVSVPVMTSIRYGPVSILVDENRYQITDRRFGNLASSPIVPITKKYFGTLLRYTPLTAGGINFNGLLRFESQADEHGFNERLGLDAGKMAAALKSTDVRVGLVVSFPWHNGVVEVQMPKPKDRAAPGLVNFNYEFGYTDIDSFLSNLDDAELVYGRFREFLDSLAVEGAL